jgi:PAS domain S-box-containing protein
LQAEPLLALAAVVASKHDTTGVLDAIVRGLAAQQGSVLARIWLIRPGDICDDCYLRAECLDQSKCLHLSAAATGAMVREGDFRGLDGPLRRIPLTYRKVPVTIEEGKSVLVSDHVTKQGWLTNAKLAEQYGVRGFIAHPLIFRGEVLGTLTIFSSDALTEDDLQSLRLFADQAAVAIVNARAHEEETHARNELLLSETQFRSLLELTPVAIFLLDDSGNISSANLAAVELMQGTIRDVVGKSIASTYLPEDLVEVGTPLERRDSGRSHQERRFLRRDGSVVAIEIMLSASFPGGRQVVIRDLTEQKRAEKVLEEHARQMKQVIDTSPVHMFMWEPDASASFGNQASRDYFGEIPPMLPMDFLALVVHPEDYPKLKSSIEHALSTETRLQTEARMRRSDGEYRWFTYDLKPLRDGGKLWRWCGTRVDIDDQRRMVDQAQRENLALREEIDKISMFEEIVGTSSALQPVLARIAKVAPTESTVLITGETGTGKELIARGIHRRSNRSQRAFVSVNCAAIPKDLIASELFGHEKGAFTGALQRRLGRFELAEGGTIFLDEIGELPAETQVALLRVLQEREFDRVGGAKPIKADVRILAATHRDLPSAIAAGTFRSDLFYRVNVFPIEAPPLRDRKEDIRLLVEYFIDRYSVKMGKNIRRIDRRSLEALRAYAWPGNIRELQNVIERSVIVCEGEEFAVDESWLTHATPVSRPLGENLLNQEKELIEEALVKTKGRVSGQSGAAALLGMPPSTLDSKIKTLKIDKRRFNMP